MVSIFVVVVHNHKRYGEWEWILIESKRANERRIFIESKKKGISEDNAKYHIILNDKEKQ